MRRIWSRLLRDEPEPSPYFAVSDELDLRVSALSRRAQAAFYAGASLALASGGFRTPTDAAWPNLLDRGVAGARAFALTGAVDDRTAEDLAPLRHDYDPYDEPYDHSTLAQDAWICVRTAAVLCFDELEVEEGRSWNVLEPQFHAAMQRRYGVDEAEIVDEPGWEAEALRDPELAHAIAAVHEALDLLRDAPAPSEAHLLRVTGLLGAIRPGASS